ncbi:hypothetical protein [Candidatus Phytoplasma solani]|uniref:hypothetical protein n=1 Tax=Candidatus Phytoplasma solani TaxID=69896 RepID=UPI0003B7C919|nr:hypothetical protein S231_02040 [Candidatus Phytoplasma solani]
MEKHNQFKKTRTQSLIINLTILIIVSILMGLKIYYFSEIQDKKVKWVSFIVAGGIMVALQYLLETIFRFPSWIEIKPHSFPKNQSYLKKTLINYNKSNNCAIINKKQLIKDVLAFVILFSIFLIIIIDKISPDICNKTIITICRFLAGLICISFPSYIGFKICKGTNFIYKKPHQGKTLINIDLGESFPSKHSMKYIRYEKDLPIYDKKTFMSKMFYILISFLLLTLILFIINFLLQRHDNSFPILQKIIKSMLEIFFYMTIPLAIAFCFCDTFSYLWFFYAKFFRLLGLFPFLEKDFNNTINSHHYFPISIFYEQNKKKI